MQNFSYHTHNNFGGIFDGRNSCEEMVSQAEKIGFKEIGVSNHFVLHPNAPASSPMFFQREDILLDIFKRCYEEIDEAASRHKIKIYKGIEVDFFPSSGWRNKFEKIIKELSPDYIIGTTHFIRNKDESKMYNIYHLNELPSNLGDEEFLELLEQYWQTLMGAAESGYFDFMAHLDYCTQFNLCIDQKWVDVKHKLIDVIAANNIAVEINTGGTARIGRPFPEKWMIEELIKKDVPLLISDDSHEISHLGRHFQETEDLLKELKCKKRFSL